LIFREAARPFSLSAQDVSGAALDAAVRRGTLFVKRRLGALAYADDPVGSRSLLSRAFHAPAATAAAADADASVGRNTRVWVAALLRAVGGQWGRALFDCVCWVRESGSVSV